jgi:ElaB/YqjD/DUF883 family membrane-anchored ribosome-binding protein
MTQATDQQGQQEGLKEQAAAKVQDATSVAQDKASELREQGSMRLREQFDQRSNEAGTQVRSLAEALRRGGNDLSTEGHSSGAQLTGQAADRLEQLGSYLEQKRGDELMRDIEMFARRRPWMLAAIGMLAGVAAARFMKASSEQRYESYPDTSRQWTSRYDDRYPRRQLPTGSGGTPDYGRTGAGMTDGLTDDPLARDPYASTR